MGVGGRLVKHLLVNKFGCEHGGGGRGAGLFVLVDWRVCGFGL